jgi:hypothetical protein
MVTAFKRSCYLPSLSDATDYAVWNSGCYLRRIQQPAMLSNCCASAARRRFEAEGRLFEELVRDALSGQRPLVTDVLRLGRRNSYR